MAKRIYLDYAATTPLDSAVMKAMSPYFTEDFGNPGSLHWFGQKALAAVDESRATVARFLGAEPAEIIFTGSATEANNLAIRGAVGKWKIENRKSDVLPHIVTTAIEHESVLETCRDLERCGKAAITYLPVSREGLIHLEDLEKALRPETVLVSIMYANNEIGTIQPIAEITAVIRKWKIENRKSIYPLFHADAAQAVQFLDCNVEKLGVDFMTLSAHKIYGPKGIGALYARTPQLLSPIITGGGQEYGLRSATENVPAIVGFGKAVELAEKNRESSRKKVTPLRKKLWNGIIQFAPAAVRHGPKNEEFSLPNVLNVSFMGHQGEDLLFLLDRRGIAVSTGSTCRSRSAKPSHVLEAAGASKTEIDSAVRFSLGRPTSSSEISAVIKELKYILRYPKI